jgi:hypothetical protein
MNPGVVIGVEGEMWWSRETDTNEIIVVFFFNGQQPFVGN